MARLRIYADDSTELVVRIGRALHRYGAPAHRLEGQMRAVGGALGHEVEAFCTPTALFVSSEGEPAVMLRVGVGEDDLAKLAAVEAVTRRVEQGRLSAAEAVIAIGTIESAPPLYGPTISLLAFGAACASSVIFFGGDRADAMAAAIVGLVVGMLGALSARHEHAPQAYVAVASLLASLIASALGRGSVVTICGLIVLVPGLAITVAMTELATQNLQSGSARLAGAMTVLLQMGLGVAIGHRLLPDGPASELIAHGVAVEALALVTVSLCFVVLFRAPMRDAPAVILACALGLVGARVGDAFLGPRLGPFAGALAVGVVANLYARWLDRPAVNVSLPGTMLLVPGSVGFRSVVHFIDQDVLTAVETAFDAALIAVAIAAGLLVANVVVAPRRLSR